MASIKDLSIEYFLPLLRMNDLAATAHSLYLNAHPYPHIVFDNFFDPLLLDEILVEFPKPGQIAWQSFNNQQEIKLASGAEANFGPMTRLFLYHLNSLTFLQFLSRVTGIQHLIPDPHFEGGGLHQIVRGGKLGIHADFNRHRDYGLDRRLNLLLYLNKDWCEHYGGGLELWDRSMTQCQKRIYPIFNRVMVFGTTDYTYHGHPDPLLCPEGMSRKSLALYYYSNGRPSNEINDSHSTLFMARNEHDFKLSFNQRLRKIAKDIVPPIIARSFQKQSRVP